MRPAILCLIIMLAASLAACSPSEEAIQLAIEETMEARPSDTPIPTETAAPSRRQS